MAVSAVGFDLDLVTLPHQQTSDIEDSDNDDDIKEQQKPNSKSTKWDWNALFIPLNDRNNYKSPLTPSSIPLNPSSKQQTEPNKSPLKHTTQTYRNDKEVPPWISNSYSNESNHYFLDRLHMELIDFCVYISPTKEEDSMRLKLIEKIKKIVLELWPDANIHIFGSMKTKLYLPTSDIDIVVYPNNSNSNSNNKIDPKLLLAQSLKTYNMCSYLEIISSARVPLVKFTDNSTHLSVDICFERETGIIAADEINSLQQKYPVLRPLTYFLKYFLWYRCLNEPFHGGMGSYLLQMLIVNLIQTHPIRAIRRWRYVDSEISLGSWLMAFFELYGKHFNYSELGISPFPNAHYFIKEDHGMKIYERPYLLCCECPFESTSQKLMDSGRNTYNIMKIKSSFDWAYNTLLAHNNNNINNKSILCLLIGLRGQMLTLRSKENKLVKFELTPQEIEMNQLLQKTFENNSDDDDDSDSDSSSDSDDDDDDDDDDESDKSQLYISFDNNDKQNSPSLSTSSLSSSSTTCSTSSSSSSSYGNHIYGSDQDIDINNKNNYYSASEFQHNHLFGSTDNKNNNKSDLNNKNDNNITFTFENQQNIEQNPYLNKKYDPYKGHKGYKRKLSNINDKNKPSLKRRKTFIIQGNKNNKHISRSYSLSDLRKSTLCVFYQKGHCNKGDLCPFKHDIKGIANKNVLIDNSDQICWNFGKTGHCPRGNKCRWLHSTSELIQT